MFPVRCVTYLPGLYLRAPNHGIRAETMPWLETSPVEQRERFIRDQRVALYTMSEFCARYAISRKTGYKWRERFDEAGRLGLRDRSRAPRSSAHARNGRDPAVDQEVCPDD